MVATRPLASSVQMQLIKWCAVPASVLVAAFELAVTSQFDSTPISILYAFSSLAALPLAAGNLRPRRINQERRLQMLPRGNRLSERFLQSHWHQSFILMSCAFLVLLLTRAARTATSFGLAFTIVVWCSIVKFGATNVLTHHYLLRTHRSD